MMDEFETKFREAQERAAPRRKTSADQREWTSAQKRTSQEWRDPHNRANGNAWRGSEAALIVQCAAEIAPEPVAWLWPGRIAIGKLTLIAGVAGLGKSQLSIAVAAAVTTGGDWPCGEGQAPLGNIIILSAEDGTADTIVPRLMAAGADKKRVHIVSAVQSRGGRRAFSLQSDLESLARKVAEIGGVRLIVIDPISSYLGAKVDSHVNAAVRSVLEPVSELAARLKIALLAITHPPKGTGTTAINRFIGSIAFVAAARAAFMVTQDPNDETRRLFLPVKNNLAALGKGFAFRLEQRIVGESGHAIVASAVVWERNHIDISADQALQAVDTNNNGGSPTLGEAEEFLRSLLADGAMATNKIKQEAKAAGVSWATVRRAKDQLAIKSQKGGMGDGWVWAMPKMLKSGEDAHAPDVSTFGANEHLRAKSDAKSPSSDDAWPDLPAFLDRLGKPG